MTLAKLVVAITGNSAGLSSALTSTSKMVGGLGAKLRSSLGSIGITPGLLGVGAIGLLGRQALISGDRLADLSHQLGILPDQLIAIQIAGERAGVSQEQVVTSIQKWTRTLADAAQGITQSGAVDSAFQALRLSAQDLIALPVAEQIATFADAFANLENATQRNQIAMTLFGRGGAAMVNLLSEGSAGINRAARDMQRLGATIGFDTLNNIEKFNDDMMLMRQVIEITAMKAVSALAPAFTSLISWITRASGWIGELIRNNDSLVTATASLAVGLGILAVAVKALTVAETALALVQAFVLGMTGAGLVMVAAGITATLLAASVISGLQKDMAQEAAENANETDKAAKSAGNMAGAAFDMQKAFDAMAKPQEALIDRVRLQTAQMGMSTDEIERHNLSLTRMAEAQQLTARAAGATAEEVAALAESFNAESDALMRELEFLQKSRAEKELLASQTKDITQLFDDLNQRIHEIGLTGDQIDLSRLIDLGASAEEIRDFENLIERMRFDEQMAKQAKGVDQIFDEINQRIDEIGLTSQQIDMSRLIDLGASMEDIREFENLIAKFEDDTKRLAEADDLKQFAENIAESIRTPAEEFKGFRDQIDLAVTEGLLTAEQAALALENRMASLMKHRSEFAGAVEKGSVAAFSISARGMTTGMEKLQERSLRESQKSNRLLTDIKTNTKEAAEPDFEVVTI